MLRKRGEKGWPAKRAKRKKRRVKTGQRSQDFTMGMGVTQDGGPFSGGVYKRHMKGRIKDLVLSIADLSVKVRQDPHPVRNLLGNGVGKGAGVKGTMGNELASN